MATPTLTKHSLSGTLGPILIDIRAGAKDTSRPAVVIVHGFKGFKDWGMFPHLAERLARAGFVALTFNLSGSGVDDAGEFSLPDRFGHNTFSAELQDLSRVIDALMLARLGVAAPSALGLLGHSRGGGISVLQTARDPRVQALVTWSAISRVERWPDAQRTSWRTAGHLEIKNARTGQIFPLYTDVLDDLERNAEALDIEAAAGRIAVPWLIIHGTQDESVHFAEGRALAAAAGSKQTRLLPIEGGGHTFGATHPWRSATPEIDAVFDASVRWLTQHLQPAI
jgi:alpha-beta hydrolase superfamily lysophospholipase